MFSKSARRFGLIEDTTTFTCLMMVDLHLAFVVIKAGDSLASSVQKSLILNLFKDGPANNYLHAVQPHQPPLPFQTVNYSLNCQRIIILPHVCAVVDKEHFSIANLTKIWMRMCCVMYSILMEAMLVDPLHISTEFKISLLIIFSSELQIKPYILNQQ